MYEGCGNFCAHCACCKFHYISIMNASKRIAWKWEMIFYDANVVLDRSGFATDKSNHLWKWFELLIKTNVWWTKLFQTIYFYTIPSHPTETLSRLTVYLRFSLFVMVNCSESKIGSSQLTEIPIRIHFGKWNLEDSPALI